jgi:hypothetical protein
VAQGVVILNHCVLERNEATGTFAGGVDPPSVAFGLRGQDNSGAPATSIVVRNTRFTLNQLAVRLDKATAAVALDFGNTSEDGNNIFTIEPTSPWNPLAGTPNPALPAWATDANITYVNFWMANETIDAMAIGNTWSYLAPSCSTAYNQSVCTNTGQEGTFECLTGPLTFTDDAGSAGLNMAGGSPNRRATTTNGCSGTNDETCCNNNPLNFAISNNAKSIRVH